MVGIYIHLLADAYPLEQSILPRTMLLEEIKTSGVALYSLGIVDGGD